MGILLTLKITAEARAVISFPVFTCPHIRFTSRPVDLEHLVYGDACVSYGAEGTVATFLLAGVPQLISPWHVEAYMAARRVEALGAAVVLRGEQTVPSVMASLVKVCTDVEIRRGAQELSHRYQSFNPCETAHTSGDVIICTSAAEHPAVSRHRESVMSPLSAP